ncbi:MAG: hypothetical protein KF850_14515 [Labilithrix sp.]|nr:hypothetical protein [Labilithrix sp.]
MTRLRLLPGALTLSRNLAVGLTAALGALVVAAACAPESSRVGPGDECFLATDCEPGLVCIEQANKTRICSDDLSRVSGEPPAEGDGEGGAGGDAADDGGEQPTPEGGPIPDTGAPDTTAPPDTGAPTDAGED